MTRYIITFLLACMTSAHAVAQTCQLPIAVAVKKDASPISEASQRIVANRLRQLLTGNGVSATSGLHTFALVPGYEIIGKSVTPGPPRQTVCQLQLSLSVVNASDGVVFAAFTTELDGVGQSDQAAVSDAIKRLTARHQGVAAFVGEAEKKILAYYEAQSDRIIAHAEMLDQTRHYDEAISLLLTIPNCASAYPAALQRVMEVWQHRVNDEGEHLLTRAKAVWAARTNSEAALDAARLLATIDPESSSFTAAGVLLEEIKSKVEANTPWDVSFKVLDNTIDMEHRRLEAAKEVAMAYAENQQKTDTNLLFIE